VDCFRFFRSKSIITADTSRARHPPTAAAITETEFVSSLSSGTTAAPGGGIALDELNKSEAATEALDHTFRGLNKTSELSNAFDAGKPSLNGCLSLSSRVEETKSERDRLCKDEA
jgi:hypothetical protein